MWPLAIPALLPTARPDMIHRNCGVFSMQARLSTGLDRHFHVGSNGSVRGRRRSPFCALISISSYLENQLHLEEYYVNLNRYCLHQPKVRSIPCLNDNLGHLYTQAGSIRPNIIPRVECSGSWTVSHFPMVVSGEPDKGTEKMSSGRKLAYGGSFFDRSRTQDEARAAEQNLWYPPANKIHGDPSVSHTQFGFSRTFALPR